MPQYVAFLRGINVGGHRVKMEGLRGHFAALGFEDVETFLASGNVVFVSPEDDAVALEQRIEKRLAKELGFATATQLRTLRALAEVVAYPAFPRARTDDSLYVCFLRAEPEAATRRAIDGLRSEVDDFRVNGRELYWLCRGKISEVSVAWPKLEKLLRTLDATSRNLATVRKLVDEYGAART
jgi:uncharacterized protein (DUF1697 family)